MPDQYRAAKIERVDEGVQIVRPGVNIVAGSGLIGIAVTPPVMGDGTVTLGVEKQHLCFPRRASQWPAVGENDRRSGAPVTIVDPGTVAGSDLRHGISPSLISARRETSRDEPYASLTRTGRWFKKRTCTFRRDFVNVNEELLPSSSALHQICAHTYQKRALKWIAG